jgi:uncharacterized membrane protein required for colicin V production
MQLQPWVIDISVVVLILGMTYALMSEGLWGAALMFFNALFAGLIAFNFYEPLAAMLSGSVSQLSGYADTLCLLVLFAVTLFILRLITDSIAPTMVRFPTPVYHIGRVLFALGGASVTMAILLLSFHTAPIHKKMFTAYTYEQKPPFGMGLDWKWLAFFQYTTGQTFANFGNDPAPDPTGEYFDANVFDPQGRWLIDHQNARPYGEEGTVPPPIKEEAPAGGAGGGGSAGGGGGSPGGQGMPGPQAGGQSGPGIPGGTAGAAAGLAPTNP